MTLDDLVSNVMRSMEKNEPSPIRFPITARPALEGAQGRAWLCNPIKPKPKVDGTLQAWLIEAPLAHPAWHSYLLTLVHLRPMPGTETLLYLEDATHEFLLLALDPNIDYNEMLHTGLCPGALQPANFAAQFIEASDATACVRIQGTVQMVIDGTLSPDPDFRRDWIKLFGSNMCKDHNSTLVGRRQD